MKHTSPFSSTTITRSLQIREIYHLLELQHHGSEWTVGEDALAFLTDAALVGRLTMDQQRRWPVEADSPHELGHKLGECLWWLIVLAKRMDIDPGSALETFLTSTEQQLDGSLHQPTPPPTKTNVRTKKTAKPAVVPRRKEKNRTTDI